MAIIGDLLNKTLWSCEWQLKLEEIGDFILCLEALRSIMFDQ